MGIVLPITLVTAGIAAIINIWLSARTGRIRTQQKISIGDGGDTRLIAAMRAQANFVENTPFTLILLGVIELAIGTQLWLWAIAGVYSLARIAHGIGMTSTKTQFRVIGTIITLLTLIALALTAIAIPYLMPSAGTITEITVPNG